MNKKLLFQFFLIFALGLPVNLWAQEIENRAYLDSIGARNAVRKAHQMTDLQILPQRTFFAHKNKTYLAGKSETGLIYSSTKEINTSVGQDVSFHTFMTALHNPQSILYSERIDELPYHGQNCGAYYGTVCSGLVTYALGFKITQRSADIPVADYMEMVEDQSVEGVHVADVIWSDGHVQLVTGIERGKDGQIEQIEICESVYSGCRRVYYDKDSFNLMLKNKEKKKILYRYKYLYKNTEYVPVNEFVASDGETLVPFVYNDDICTSKGDKACYITGEDVALNILKDNRRRKIEVYKDSKLFKTIKISPNDECVVLKNYPYGNYQARVISRWRKSDYTKWIIVDVHVDKDIEKGRVIFSSANGQPIYYEFSNISGGRPTNKNRVYAAEFNEEDVKNGYVTVKAPKQPTEDNPGYPFIKVHFLCEYGMVINRPLNWFE